MNLGNPFQSFGLCRTLLTATGLLAATCGTASSRISWSSDYNAATEPSAFYRIRRQ